MGNFVATSEFARGFAKYGFHLGVATGKYNQADRFIAPFCNNDHNIMANASPGGG